MSRAPLVLLAALLSLGAARAQTPCPDALAGAESLYRAGRFAEVEARLEPCFAAPGTPEAAFRLLALALVRQGRVDEAREIVLRLLVAHPAYEADPVQDPPVYLSLVDLVRRQVGPPPRPAPRPAPRPRVEVAAVPPAPPQAGAAPRVASARLPVPEVRVEPAPRARRWSAELSLGAESYDGERRRVGGGLASGFVRNAGLSPAAGVAFALTRHVAVDVRAQAVRLPRLVRDGLADDETGWGVPPGGTLGEPAASYVTLDPASTGRWVPSLTVGVRGELRPGRGVSPYGRLAARGLVRRVNGRARVGIGPDVALGVVGGGRRVAAFGEVGGVLVAPDGALDAAVFRANGDLLLGARLGLRLR